MQAGRLVSLDDVGQAGGRPPAGRPSGLPGASEVALPAVLSQLIGSIGHGQFKLGSAPDPAVTWVAPERWRTIARSRAAEYSPPSSYPTRLQLGILACVSNPSPSTSC